MNEPDLSPQPDNTDQPDNPVPAVIPPVDTEGVVAELVEHQLRAVRGGASLERLAELEAKITLAYRGARAESTLVAYRSDFSDFTIWCLSVGLDSMPATPATVAAYLAELASPPDDRVSLAMSTIERRVASLGEAHKAEGHQNPCADPLVRQVMKGIRRQIGTAPQNRKKGLSTADIRAVVAGIDGTRLIEVRDQAVLLIGFSTAMRRSELAALTTRDIEDHPEGIIVWKRKSKTDQEARGERIEVAYGEHPYTCPVRAVRLWIDEAGISDGPLFRGVNRHSQISVRPMSGQGIVNIVKKHAQRIGLNPADFAGHSLRRGFATEAARNGATERSIARTTKHTSTRGLQPYIEDAELFTDPPSKYLGL